MKELGVVGFHVFGGKPLSDAEQAIYLTEIRKMRDGRRVAAANYPK